MRRLLTWENILGEYTTKNSVTGCLEWTGCKDVDGYGRFSDGGKSYGIHRLVWEVFKGDIPQGLYVLHKCDNPSCINTEHLYIGTAADNTRDKVKRRRTRLPNFFLMGEYDILTVSEGVDKLIELPITYMELYLRWSGMEQQQLAYLSNIPQPKISVMCKKGIRKVSETALIRIKRVLDFPGEPMQLLERVTVREINLHETTKPTNQIQQVTLL